MQSSSGAPQAEAILEWLQQEMSYRAGEKEGLPSAEALRRICRGNMVPVWKFLLDRVKSERTVETIRRNILVHVSPSTKAAAPLSKSAALPAAKKGRESPSQEKRDAPAPVPPPRAVRKRSESKGRGRNLPADEAAKSQSSKNSDAPLAPEKDSESGSESRERALKERDAAEIELERLRHTLERLQKDTKRKMLELSREEGERQRVLDDRTNSRHKKLLLEAYDERCEQSICIFTEYQRRLVHHVDHASDAQRGITGTEAASDSLDQDSVFATSIKEGPATNGLILIETAQERSIRMACEQIASCLIEKLRAIFPAFDVGEVSQQAIQPEDMMASFDLDPDGIPETVKETAFVLLKNPPQLLRAIATYTARIVSVIGRETEKIDVRADAEKLRYKYENNRIIEDVTFELDDNLLLQSKGNGDVEVGVDVTSKGAFRQLRERQRAHVQQFMATEEALNQAAEARKACEELIRRIHRDGKDGVSDQKSGRDFSLNLGSSRQFELEVWTKERELSGLKASVSTLNAEVQRLKKMSADRKAAEDALRQKWKRIEEFDARRSELEALYTSLIHSNLEVAASWEQHARLAREHSAKTIVPVCSIVQEKASGVRDLVEREVIAFQNVPDNRLYMLPVSPQALLDSFGLSGAASPDALVSVQKRAELVAACASAGDPSAIASIRRISAVSQSSAGYRGQDAGLAAIVESMRFCLRPCLSPASSLEELSKSMSKVQTLKHLLESGQSLLVAANNSRPEHERNAIACATTATEQEKVALEQWLVELKAAVREAQRCLGDCRRVHGLVEEWWEQPAATAVDWISIDSKNVATWLAHVKQLQTAFYDKELL